MRIVWRGNFDISGFGRASTDYVAALKKLGVDIKVINTSIPSIKLVTLPIEISQLEIKTNKKEDILIQHVTPNNFKPTDAAVNIGCTTFESPKLRQEWVSSMQVLDGILVPSQWNKDVLTDHGLDEKKIYVIPLIVGYLSTDPSRVEPLLIRNKKKFSFLSVFDFTYRKGWDILLEAYWTEFRPEEDVSLILKVYHNTFRKDDRNKAAEYINDFKSYLKLNKIPSTIIYDWPIENNLLASLYKSVQAYVLPSRGEGFSLTHAEAMAMQIPVIGTHYGGHTDYMNYTNSHLIEIKGLQEMTKEQLKLSPHYEDLQLAEPSVAHLRETMRNVYVHYDEALEKARKARLDIKDKFHEIKVGVKLLETIERIAYH
jgi:hypothetical protein